jgi:hypothetical protein
MTIKVKLAAIAKDEAAYIPQWIYHHLEFGFQEIEIWLNNTTDNSVELLTELQKQHNPGIVKFRNADDLLHKCLSENLQFQQMAYTQIYEEALTEANCTHILFLDLDEFWTPKNFTSTIGEFISEVPECDAISFQWLIDTPNPRLNMFSPPFSFNNTLQKNRHVKTLTKLTPRMKELSVHNHIIEDGVYRTADGEYFPGNDRETANKSLIPTSLHSSMDNAAGAAFVLHQINRTPVEYLSSLLRGRGHKNDDNVFKVNRIGYILDNNSLTPTNFKIPSEKIVPYQNRLERYYNAIPGHIEEARDFIIKRFHGAVQKIRNKPELLNTYRNQIRGVKLNDLLNDDFIPGVTIHTLDKITVENGYLRVEGWAFDPLSDETPGICFTMMNGDSAQQEFARHERRDVAAVYPDGASSCGFAARVSIPNGETRITLSITSSGGTQEINLPLTK